MPGPENVTQLLKRWKAGDAAAENELAPLVYDHLHKLAAVYLRNQRPGATLQPTALVNELYLQMVGNEIPDVENRAHFFGIAAHRMRQIIMEAARKHSAAKRGGGVVNLELNEALAFAPERAGVFVALDDALEELGRLDARKVKILELRYFGGLEQEEIAKLLGISVPTIRRDQRMAEAWLRTALSGGGPAAAPQS